MARLRQAVAGGLAGLVTVAQSQYTGWTQGQVNVSMCLWSQARAAVIRDTLYIDGGDLYWSRGLNDGTFDAPYNDNNPLGLVYSLNFSQPFKTSQNLTALFQTTSKAAGGTGSANNIAPNYHDGAMLANDAEYFLYGGLLTRTAAFAEPHADDVLAYQAYQYGPVKESWHPGFLTARLPSGITRYLAFGGAANAPSEQKAFYFGGLKSPSAGPIYDVSTNASINAVNASEYMLILDMSTQQQETWKNVSLPSNIQARANPELVWVPVGSQGILVAIGGVLLPQWAYSKQQSENPSLSKQESIVFLNTIDVYDVATGNWYQQPTQGGPTTPLARGCSVLGTAKDKSSFNIYYYGGFDGVDAKSDFSDQVWVLSLPSFTWTLLSAGSPQQGRAGAKCVAPYPDQMMVVGGYTPMPGGSLSCLGGQNGAFIRLFNLTSGAWFDSYDPAVHGDYGVPTAVQQKIGGGATGSATLTTPATGGWATPALASVFAAEYPATKITTWYPYGSVTSTSRPTLAPTPGGNGGGLPSWVAPTLGVILGLVFVTSLIVLWFLWRRRRVLRGGSSQGPSEPGTEDNGMRILSWIRGQQSEPKAPTVTTEETPTSPGDMSEVSSPVVAPVGPVRHEMENTQIAELMDTSPRPELQDTGLSPVEIINKHSHFAPGRVHRSESNPSYTSDSRYSDQNSLVSRSSGALGTFTRAQSPSISGSSQDAAAAGATASSPTTARHGNARVTSGVSSISERDAGHLRHISETTVSSQESGGIPEEEVGPGGQLRAPPAQRPSIPSVSSPISPGEAAGLGPVSPPTAEERVGGDYITARQAPAGSSTGSPLRKSMFRESEADLGDGR